MLEEVPGLVVVSRSKYSVVISRPRSQEFPFSGYMHVSFFDEERIGVGLVIQYFRGGNIEGFVGLFMIDLIRTINEYAKERGPGKTPRVFFTMDVAHLGAQGSSMFGVKSQEPFIDDFLG